MSIVPKDEEDLRRYCLDLAVRVGNFFDFEGLIKRADEIYDYVTNQGKAFEERKKRYDMMMEMATSHEKTMRIVGKLCRCSWDENGAPLEAIDELLSDIEPMYWHGPNVGWRWKLPSLSDSD